MNKQSENIPLSVILEDSRNRIRGCINHLLNEMHIPAFLLEGIVEGALADIRSQKNQELLSDISRMNEPAKTGGESDGGTV